MLIRAPGPTATEDFDADEGSKGPVNLHIVSGSAAQWLSMVKFSSHEAVNWRQEIVETYSRWTSKMNGLDLPTDANIVQAPTDWNQQYYQLFAW